MAEALFREPMAAHVLLAAEGRQLAGMATYSFLWPAAGVTRSLYLKEIYVAEAFRGKGIGTSLMRRLCQIAIEHACSRVEWTTDKGNVLGEEFFKQLGVSKNQEKVVAGLEVRACIGWAATRSYDHLLLPCLGSCNWPARVRTEQPDVTALIPAPAAVTRPPSRNRRNWPARGPTTTRPAASPGHLAVPPRWACPSSGRH